MRYKCIVLSIILIILLLISAGCRKQAPVSKLQSNESEKINTLEEDEFYDMEDFASLVVGKSTRDDLLEQVGLPAGCFGALVGGNGIYMEYPAGNGKSIHVEINYDHVISLLELGDYNGFSTPPYKRTWYG